MGFDAQFDSQGAIMNNEPNLVQRHGINERLNHWVVAITFILLALSGLALFHPAFFFLTNLFGGGTWSRILHPFIGVVMFVSFRAWPRSSGATIASPTTTASGASTSRRYWRTRRRTCRRSGNTTTAKRSCSGRWWSSFHPAGVRLHHLATLVRAGLPDRSGPLRRAGACARCLHRHPGHHRACLCRHLDARLHPRHDPRHRHRGLGQASPCGLV